MAAMRPWGSKFDKLIALALTDAHRLKRSNICIAMPFPLADADIVALRARPLVNSIVTKSDPTDLAARREVIGVPDLGAYWEPGYWLLPETATHVYYLGPWWSLTPSMLKEVIGRNIVSLSVRYGGRWWSVPLASLRQVTKSKLVRRLLGRPISGLPPLVPPTVELFNSMLDEKAVTAASGLPSVPGRIVLVCGALSPGGAERQVVYTLLGLAAKPLESVQLLCDFLTPDHPARYDFYLPRLREAGIPARTVTRRTFQRGGRQLPEALAAARHSLPAGLLSDIADLFWEFIDLRPQVVHAWLDWSNIRAGLAAALAGVPRIVISGRNLNPSHFALYQPYMDPAYKALCALPNVVFVNNSQAGADDYAKWLGVPPSRIQVVRNGVDFGASRRASASAIARARAALGIAPRARVVGGIFRFYPEKRPLLWLEVAAEVLKRCPDAHFVLYGDGILRDEMENAAKLHGLDRHLLMAGVTDDVLSALSAMDVFLLTSFSEGLPNVALEAQWVGTPVVATNGGGTAEAINPDVTGWIVDPPSAHALADRVVWLLTNPDKRARALDAGPEFVRERFGPERMIEETLLAYGIETSDGKVRPSGREAFGLS